MSKLAPPAHFFSTNPLPIQIFFVYLQRQPRVTGNAEVRPVSVGRQARQGFWDAGVHLVLFCYIGIGIKIKCSFLFYKCKPCGL